MFNEEKKIEGKRQCREARELGLSSVRVVQVRTAESPTKSITREKVENLVSFLE